VWQQAIVAFPRLAQRVLQELIDLNVLARIWVSFCGGVFAAIAYFVLCETGRTLAYLARQARNIVAPRARPERVDNDATPLRERLELLGFAAQVMVGSVAFALATVAAVAGIVIVAAGGGFGGAGALVRW
jgi:hypothetical protein